MHTSTGAQGFCLPATHSASCWSTLGLSLRWKKEAQGLTPDVILDGMIPEQSFNHVSLMCMGWAVIARPRSKTLKWAQKAHLHKSASASILLNVDAWLPHPCFGPPGAPAGIVDALCACTSHTKKANAEARLYRRGATHAARQWQPFYHTKISFTGENLNLSLGAKGPSAHTWRAEHEIHQSWCSAGDAPGPKH